MKALTKAAIGAVAMASAAIVAAPAANAAVSFGFSFGAPVRSYASSCYRPLRFQPAYCRYPMFPGELFIGGRWYNGPFHYRVYRGHREYWMNGRWHRPVRVRGRFERRDWRRGGHRDFDRHDFDRRDFGRRGHR